MGKDAGTPDQHIPPLPHDISESKAWTLSLSPPVTLGGAATLRRQSYGPREEWRILKNLLMLGISFALLFTAFMAVANLQSSVNATENLGVYSLASLYGAFLLASLFVPPYLLARLKTKWTIVFSIAGYISYIGAQFYPCFETLIPASLFIGFSAAGLWASQSNYVTKISEEYALMKKLNPESVSQRFYGFFFLCFHSSQVWGNLISSFVLTPQNTKETIRNESFDLSDDFSHCGANFCPLPSEREPTNGSLLVESIEAPGHSQLKLLTGILLGCSVGAALLVIFGVDSLKRYGENETKLISAKWNSLMIATIKHWQNPSQVLLIPMGIWLGIQEAFLGAEFTLSYVSCAWGIHQIGFVMAAFGSSAAISALILGKAAEYVGRPVIFTTAAVCNVASLITLLNWTPKPDQPYIFFVIAVMWGIGDGVWSPQVRSIYGTIFKDTREAAFSNIGLWLSIGFIIVYINAGMFCMTLKIYLYLAILVFTLVGYYVVEFRTEAKLPTQF